MRTHFDARLVSRGSFSAHRTISVAIPALSIHIFKFFLLNQGSLQGKGALLLLQFPIIFFFFFFFFFSVLLSPELLPVSGPLERY